jgi:uncharacterized protein YkwD
VSRADYGKRWRLRRAASFSNLLLLALLTAAAAGCGVPIAAYELTPTPDGRSGGLEVLPVSRNLPAPGATVLSSLGPGVTATATPAPQMTGTAAAAVVTATAAAVATAAADSTNSTTATLSGTPALTVATSTTSAFLPADALKAVNDLRTSRGLKPFQLNATLTVAASAYAKLMADKSWFTCGCDPHTGPDGSQPDRRVSVGGYRGLFRGETLAAGQSSGAAVVSGWLASPSHAAIILDTTAVDVGVGYAFNPADPYRHYWVLETGIP